MNTYYNEIEPFAARWLRNLGKVGHISKGVVDERSIKEVRGADLAGVRRAHFFAGIGGWDYALRLAGWPADRPVWTGSCPCQPFSQAGKRKGISDERHLWPEFLRLISECQPATIFGEQVASKDGRLWLNGIRLDLEALGYAVGAADLCSAGVGAPNIRQRLYWVAQSVGERRGRRGDGHNMGQGEQRDPEDQTTGSSVFGGMGNAERDKSRMFRGDDEKAISVQEKERQSKFGSAIFNRPSKIDPWHRFDIVECTDGKARRLEPGVEPLVTGLPGRVGLLRGYGNAINPILAAEFVKAFMEVEPSSQ